MNRNIVVREYGLLLRGGDSDGLGAASLADSDWEWLLHMGPKLVEGDSPLFRPLLRGGRQVLQVLNHVGVLELPSGTIVEIVPKVSEEDSVERSRRWLLKMLLGVDELPFARFQDADLTTFDRPLLEVLIGRFLSAVQHLINQGLRSDYLRLAGEEPYMRGKLLVSASVRQPPHRRTRFPIEYDEYLLDRAENRLLCWAVDRVYHWSRDNAHRSHARKLLTLLSVIPVSEDPMADLGQWRDDRLMQSYAPVKPWIELIVAGLSPWTQKGGHQGVSLLFPMEKLFERYVFKVLRRRIAPGFTIAQQNRAGWLTRHRGEDWFALIPDFVVRKGQRLVSVLDAKWKTLDADADDRKKKYGVSQADVYQLHAYGKRCLPGGGDVFLIYPKNIKFSAPLPPFSFDDHHTLWIVPFDLERDVLVSGDWEGYCPWFTHGGLKAA